MSDVKSYNHIPSCKHRQGDYCAVSTAYFGKPLVVSNLWCNGPCKMHNGPYDGRTQTKEQEIYFAIRLFLRNYSSSNDDFIQKVITAYQRPVNLQYPIAIYNSIKRELNLPNKILLTGSLLTKETGHKDYDIVIIVRDLNEIAQLKLPTHIDGVKCDYFYLTKPSISFYAATMDVEEKILYKSSWFYLTLESTPPNITIVECECLGIDKILHDIFQVRKLTVKDGLHAVEALLFGTRVSKEEQDLRETICSGCEFNSFTGNNSYCRLCGCNTKGHTLTLTAFTEKLPQRGCKHPQRKEGKGWPLQLTT